MTFLKTVKKVTITTIGALVLGACAQTATPQTSSNTSSAAAEVKTVKVASIGSDAQIWRHIAELDATKKAGLKIEVEEINTGTALNQSVADELVDANAFQSIGYLDSFNAENNNVLVPIGTTYIEPMGIYSKKFKSIDEIKEGAVIALADNPANTTRGLRLLEASGLIKLKADFNDGTGTPADVVENPKKLEFKLIDDTTAVRVLEDVDAALIGNTIALEGGLNVLKDSIFKEEPGENTKSRINVIVVKKGKETDASFKKLVDLYHTKEAQEYIAKEFHGTKVQVQKPVSEVWSAK